jgi:DNA-binding GntR family transcriptional regulator
MTLKEIESATLKDSVYKQLSKAILSGAIPPGERLTLQGIAEQLNVSIMPVREAIRKLEAGKFITVQKRKIIVNKLSPDNVYEILEARLLLEGHVAEKASLKRGIPTMDILEQTFEMMKGATDTDTYIQSNRLFHETLYEAGGTPVMMEIITSLWDRYTPYIAILNDRKQGWNNAYFVETHSGMLMGMRRKSPMEVRKWLEKDITTAADLIVELLVNESDEAADEAKRFVDR